MLPVVAILAAAVLFGTTGLAQALGPDSSNPFGVGFVRMAIGGTTLAVVATLIGLAQGARPSRSAAKTFLLAVAAGACMFGYQPLFFAGVANVGVAVGTIVALGSAPLIAGALEAALLRRAPGRTWALTTIVAIAGVTMLAVGGSPAQGGNALGLLSAVGAGAMFAGFSVTQRRLLVAGWTPLRAIGTAGAVASLLSLAMLPFVDLTWLADAGGVAMSLWLGLGATALAYTLFTLGLRGVSGATAATLTLAEPLVAAVLGLTVLRESLTLLQLAGLLAIGVAIVALSVSARRPRADALVERDTHVS